MSDPDRIVIRDVGDESNATWYVEADARPLPYFRSALYDDRRSVPRDLWLRYLEARSALDQATEAMQAAEELLPGTIAAQAEQQARTLRARLDAASADQAYAATQDYLFAKGIDQRYGPPLTLPPDES